MHEVCRRAIHTQHVIPGLKPCFFGRLAFRNKAYSQVPIMLIWQASGESHHAKNQVPKQQANQRAGKDYRCTLVQWLLVVTIWIRYFNISGSLEDCLNVGMLNGVRTCCNLERF